MPLSLRPIVLLALLLLALPPGLRGASFAVTRYDDTAPNGGGVAGDLRNAITLANAIPDSEVQITGSAAVIVLQAPLPNVSNGMTIRSVGPVQVISGNQLHRILFIDALGGRVTLQNLQLRDGRAAGGAGGDGGGGGGLGAGGAVFVNTGIVTLQAVECIGSAVRGGNGGNGGQQGNAIAGAGGGGLGGAGGAGDTAGGSGGGGGFRGAGGGPGTALFTGAGGGGGSIGNGGAGSSAGGQGAGGGGGALGDGGDAIAATGGAGGNGGGGAGQSAGIGPGGQPGAANGGGGGGGFLNAGATAPGGNGGRFGGGGGGWYATGLTPAAAGDGGEFGGGGGNPHPLGRAGHGGWGGGGGSAAAVSRGGLDGSPGTGGFGGGGGGRAMGSAAPGGAMGGHGGVSGAARFLAGGGGGAALGGHIFVRPNNGATLTLIDCPLGAATVTAGAAGTTDPTFPAHVDAQPGAAAGSAVFFGGTDLTLRGLATVTVAGQLTDAPALPGSLTKTDDGLLIVSGDLSTTNGTSILGGTLQIGTGGTTGTLSGPVTDHGILVFDRSDAFTLGSAVTGNGAIVKRGAGTLILTGSNTYLGPTTITAGTLQVGAGGASGSIGDRLVNNGIVVFQRSDDLVYASDITGTGSLRKEGPGVLTLGGSNYYTGTTTVNGGTLSVNTDLRYGSGGLLTLNAGTLRYTGGPESPRRGFNIGAGGGTFDITNAGTLYTYFGAGTGTGTVTKRGPGQLGLGAATNSFGALLVEAGNVKIGGALNTAGTTRIGHAGGAGGSVTMAARDKFWQASGDLELGVTAPGTLTVTGGFVQHANLRMGRPGASGTLLISGVNSGFSATGDLVAGLDGAGATGAISLAGGSLFVGNNATFGRDAGTSGRITFSGGSFTAKTLIVGQAGVGIVNLFGGSISASPGPITLGASGAGGGTINVGAPEGSPPGPSSGSISGPIVGGPGNGGNLLYCNTTRGISLSSGISGNLAVRISSGSVTLVNATHTGGTQLLGGSLGISGTFTGTLLNQTVASFGSSGTNTYPGPISGVGRIEKSGSGTVIFGDTSYTGQTTLFAGTTVFSGANASPYFDLAAKTVFLEFNVASGTRDLGFATFFRGSFRKSGAGILRWPSGARFQFTGQMSIEGGEFVAGGSGASDWLNHRATLFVASGAVFRGLEADVLVADLTGGGTIFTGSANATYDGFTIGVLGTSVFSGIFADTDPANRGKLILGDVGTQIFTGSVQHTGGTLIDRGTLQIGNGGTTGSLAGDVVNRGTLAFRRSDATTFPGSISGTGAANHSGGTLTLSGTSTATGTLSVLGGRVILSGSYAGAFNVAGTARLSLAGGTIGSIGSSSVNAAGGLVDGSGTIQGSVANSGTIAVGAGQSLLVRGGTITNAASGVLRAIQGGILDLSGANALVNNGLIDLISGQILFPANFTNNGVLLDSRVVRVKAATRVGNAVTVTIDGYTAHSYQLQRSTDLAAGTFTNLGSAQAGATGGTLTFTDPAATGEKAFYRVAVD